MGFFKSALALLTILAFAGIASLPFRPNIETSADLPDSSASSLGAVSLFAALGGYRSILADFVWIKAYVEWEKSDAYNCMRSIELACAIDPNTDIFKIQGTRMIAYDMPHWFLRALPKNRRDDSALNSFRRKQSIFALALLDKGLARSPDNLDLLIAKGQVLISVDKFAEAEAVFEKAKNLTDRFYPRRLYAALAAKNGRKDAARREILKMLSEAAPDNPVRHQLLDLLKTFEGA